LGFTKLSNEDQTIITIPNKHIIGEIIHNSQANSVVESTVGIAYHCDPDKAIDAIRNALEPFLDKEEGKEPQIGIENFGDSSIDIGIRFWVPTEKYFERKYAANLAIYKALKQHGIDIPFPQRHVHLVREQIAEND
jgi:small conductance mechanosensitive channel